MLDGLMAISHAVGARDVLVQSANIPPKIIKSAGLKANSLC